MCKLKEFEVNVEMKKNIDDHRAHSVEKQNKTTQEACVKRTMCSNRVLLLRLNLTMYTQAGAKLLSRVRYKND